MQTASVAEPALPRYRAGQYRLSSAMMSGLVNHVATPASGCTAKARGIDTAKTATGVSDVTSASRAAARVIGRRNRSARYAVQKLSASNALTTDAATASSATATALSE